MAEQEKKCDLIRRDEEPTSPYFRNPNSFYPSVFDNCIDDILRFHNEWYDEEFNRASRETYSIMKDFFNENRRNHFFLKEPKFPMELKEFSTLRPSLFPSIVFSSPFSSYFGPIISPQRACDFSSTSRFWGDSLLSRFVPSTLSRSLNDYSNMNKIEDKGDKFEISFYAPGVTKGELEIDVDNDRLNIKSTHVDEYQETGKNNSYQFKETKMRSFQKSMLLPKHADPDKVKATLKDGILKIVIDKLKDSEKKKVQIQ